MSRLRYYRLMNETGEYFSMYAFSLKEAQKEASIVHSGEPESWVEDPIDGFYT